MNWCWSISIRKRQKEKPWISVTVCPLSIPWKFMRVPMRIWRMRIWWLWQPEPISCRESRGSIWQKKMSGFFSPLFRKLSVTIRNACCLLLPIRWIFWQLWPYVCPAFHRRELSAAEQYWILPGSSTVWESISVSTTAMFMHLLLGNMVTVRWRSGVQPQYPA